MKEEKTAPVDSVEHSAELRRNAEKRLQQRKSGSKPLSSADAKRLLHELEVHQVELEMQNDELRRSRIELERSLERYTELFDFAPIGYATLAQDGAIRAINLAGAQLLQHDRIELMRGRRFAGFVANEDLAKFTDFFRIVLEQEIKQSCEIALTRGAQLARQLLVTGAPLGGSEPLVLIAFEDITEQKNREGKLQRTEKALREADRRKDEFLAMLSHELRNPLAPIRNSLFVLGRAQPGSEQARRSQAILERQVAHLSRLVDDLLDVTRIRRRKIQLQREMVELSDLVRRTIDDHRTTFDSAGVKIEGRFEPGLYWVNADPARLVQVLSNVLGNAEKFTPRGGAVTISVARERNGVGLSVRDTGAGIAKDVLERLFEPFSQAPQTAERARGGLGLGLAMVRGLVELHGGRVRIDSDGPGQGTKLSIWLPLQEAPAKVAPAARVQEKRSLRVLVIDDNPEAGESLGYALEYCGHAVKVALDGPAGLALAHNFHPDVVICDIGLPGMDGYAVARAFRAEPALRDVFLVALSGYAQREDLQAATAAGFNKHIAKPASLEKMEAVLAEAPARPGSRGPTVEAANLH